MANGIKQFRIQINGITESTSAVDALNKQLDALEKRIEKINSMKVSSGGSGSGSRSSNSALSQEEAAQKEINKLKQQGAQLDAKIVAAQDEVYQRVQATKDLYKEVLQDQKAIAAQQRITANAYSNTMAGVKQHLADLKTLINVTDFGDSDNIKKMTEEANELTNKLKEMEQAYGQYGRNVGNYANGVAEGLKKISVSVGDSTREFGSAREAAKTFKNELTALEIQGKGNTKEADNLRTALYRLQSAMDDATKSSKAMDTAMDFAQSFTALASVGNGLNAFFGFDDNEITKSIQKLVALQGVLNGLETLRRQMETGEGFGAIFGKSFKEIDKYTYSLQRANVALRGTGTSARIAAAGIKVLNFALKGLMTLGIGLAIDLLVEGVQKLVGAVKDWVKGDADLISASDVMSNAIDAQNRVLEKNLSLIQKANDAQYITTEQARILTEQEYARALQETTKNLVLMADALERMGALSKNTGLQSVMGDKGVTWIGGFSKAIESIDDFIERWDYLERAVAHGGGLESWLSTASDARDEFVHLNALIGEDFMAAMKKFSDGTAEGTRKLIEYIDQMDKLTGGRYSKAIKLVKVDNEGLQKDIDAAWAMIENLRDNVIKNPIVVKMELDAKISSELDRLDPTRALQRNIDEWTQTLVFGVDESGRKLTDVERKNIEKIIAEQKKNLQKQQKQRLDSEKNAAQKLKDEAERVEREINQLRIENMKDGLEKTLKQLAEERRIKLYEAQKTGIRVEEQKALIRDLYAKKEKEAIKEHNREVAKLYHDMWEQIYRSQDDNLRMHLDSQLTEYETELKALQRMATGMLEPKYVSYGGTYIPNNMSDKLVRGLGLDTKAKGQGPIDKSMIEMAKEYLELLDEIHYAAINEWEDGEPGEKYDEAKKALDEWLEANRTTEDEMEEMWATQELREDGYVKSIVNGYKYMVAEARVYYNQVAQYEKEYYEKVKANDKELLSGETETARREENDRYAQQLAQLEENKEKGLVLEEKYNELLESMQEAHQKAMNAIQERYDSESKRIEQDHQDNIKKITADGMRNMLNEYKDAYDNISKLSSRQPQKMGGVLGDMDIINFSLTKNNYKEALEGYKNLSNDILKEKKQLQEKLYADEISFDDFKQAKRELDGLEQDVVDAAQDTQEKLKKLGGDWWGSINTWIQQIGQMMNSVMSAIWDAQDAQYEKEKEELETQMRLQEDIYNKQKQLAEDHKNAINEIEDELASARGDRRQHLIDQLNAEIEAQRRAVKEQQKAEKEQEKLKKKAEKQELEQKKREKKRALVQALINTALSISMAAVNTWPMPAIAMMAAAAAVGAAQVAAISSQKYAKGGQLDGGVAQGPRHSQGGIKVLGGMAEIEGGEFVTNRLTTSKNVELLDFINSKKKRVDLNDLIDFYNTAPKKNIRAVRTRFEDGGVVPSLNGLDISEQLQNIVVNQDNRPIVVSVVDINNKQEDVRRVKTLAGL